MVAPPAVEIPREPAAPDRREERHEQVSRKGDSERGGKAGDGDGVEEGQQRRDPSEQERGDRPDLVHLRVVGGRHRDDEAQGGHDEHQVEGEKEGNERRGGGERIQQGRCREGGEGGEGAVIEQLHLRVVVHVSTRLALPPRPNSGATLARPHGP